MTALSIQPTYPIFTDIDGQPLEAGYIWIGTANLNPITNPISVYWDAALTQPAAQPIRTVGGYPVNAGTPARLYVNSDYSIQVQNRNGSVVYSAPAATERLSDVVIDGLTFSSADVSFLQAGSGAVTRTAQAKMRDVVSVKDFGAVGDGVTDDTVAIQAALNASKYVVVPAGMTPLISSSISVPSQTKLEFLGGIGNLPSALPASYFIKKSTMTTTGIIVAERGTVIGGGILGQVGNTGDGIALAGNGAVLRDFYACKAGRDGVRVGTDGVFANCNSTLLNNVRSTDNGRYGFYVHDGVSIGPADANAGSLVDCITARNGSDGIRLGHCFWVTVINAVCEGNTGYGLYLSGANNAGIPECRWAAIIAGDYNEGNNGTVNVNQVYDGSYFSTFLQADKLSVAENSPTALAGGGRRNALAPQGNLLQGLTVYTSASGIDSDPLIVETDQTGGNTFPFVIRQRTTASNGDGPGIAFKVDPNTGTYRTAAQIVALQRTTNADQIAFFANNGGSMTAMLGLNPFDMRVNPGSDNTIKLGDFGLRWSVVYAATGTINTSDEREKQDISELDAAEKRVAVALKGLVKKFRFKDAVQKKGDGARIHVGVIAQEVMAAFQAESLDPMRYGIVCYDQWDAELDEDGNETRAAGNRYGVRYEELLAFIIAAL